MQKALVGLRLVALFAICFSVAPVSGQIGTTAIVGEVSDPQGHPIPGVRVSAIDYLAGIRRESESDEDGHYQILALPPAIYILRAEKVGFRIEVLNFINAQVDLTQRVDIRLELGTHEETITVDGSSAPMVNASDATLGNTFESPRILALPFEGRDAAGVLTLQPGVVYTQSGDSRDGALNGGRSDQANITVDGVDNNDQLFGFAFSGALRTTLDSVEEFRVTTAGINADAGRSSGGQVALITKSGTNTLHGAAFEQHRPTNMAANDWFNKHAELESGMPNVRPRFLRNTYGGAIGGPIRKDRLFFFYTYEGQKINEAAEVTRSVPSASMRDGVIFYPCAQPNECLGGIVKGQSGAAYQVSPGQFGVGPTEIQTMDPNCSAIGSCPLGNGVNPAVLTVLRQYPAATPGSSACGSFDGFGNVECNSFSTPAPSHAGTNILKLDYNITRSGTHRLSLRGNYQTDFARGVPQFQGQRPPFIFRDAGRAFAASYTAVFSATLVNTFRYGFTRIGQSVDGDQNSDLVQFRIFDSLNPSAPSGSAVYPVQNWVDDLSLTKGKHTLQIGTNIRLINNIRRSDATSFDFASINPGFLQVQPAGNGVSLDPSAKLDGCNSCDWAFPAVDPNRASVYDNSITSLVGLITEANASYNFDKAGKLLPHGAPIRRHFRAWEYDWYFQDVWRPKSTLTITAGLRYTILEPPYETSGTQAAPNLSLHDVVDKRANLMAEGLVYNPQFSFDLSGQANGKKPYWNYDYKNLGPRIAIAYSPHFKSGFWGSLLGNGVSSIRAGFGLVYDHFGEAVVDSFDQTGTFGLTTNIGNPPNQSVDGGARFISLSDIPTSSPDGVLIAPPPAGGFPATPPPTEQLFTGFGLDDKLKTPYSELVDLAFSRELPGGLVLEVAYVGRFAHRLLQQRDFAMPLDLKDPKSGMDYFAAAKLFAQAFNQRKDINALGPIPFFENFFPTASGFDLTSVAGYCGAGTPPMNPTATQALYELFSCQIGPGTFGETNALFTLDLLCPDLLCVSTAGKPTPNAFYLPQFSTLYGWSTFGKSGYNSAQVTLRTKPSHGIQFDFNYTFSKSFDTGSDTERVPVFGESSAAVVNTWAPNQLFGPSDFDVRHSVNTNWMIDVPFGRGRRIGRNWTGFRDAVFGGWQLTGLLRWSSGLPFSISNGFLNGTGPFPTNFNLSGLAMLSKAPPKTGLVTDSGGDPNVFPLGATEASSHFRFDYAGESGQRNILRGQGFFGTDQGVNKSFRISERQSLRFSAYAFNLTNSVRFDPESILSSFAETSTFGKYQRTLTVSRRLEFVLRYQF